MSLRVEFPDKYRLWWAIAWGRLTRVFIATDEQPALGSRVPVDVVLPGLSPPLVVIGTVSGRRGHSETFARGVFVEVEPRELDKCRRYLGLAPAPQVRRVARHSLRVHQRLPLQIVSLKSRPRGETRNVSETGLYVVCDEDLVAGQRVGIRLGLDDGSTISAQAEVSWAHPGGGAVGLRFVQLSTEAARRLRESVGRLLDSGGTRGDGERPVVVADDDPEILELIAVGLRKLGLDVYEAPSGIDALGLIRELRPRLVLLDVLMPGIDGADICRIMRADAELADIPLIVMSALDPAVLRILADETGATDFLAKPFRLAEVTALVGRYLD